MGKIDISKEPNPRSAREWRRLIPGIAISLISLVILLYFIDLQQFKQAITGAKWNGRRFFGLAKERERSDG